MHTNSDSASDKTTSRPKLGWHHCWNGEMSKVSIPGKRQHSTAWARFSGGARSKKRADIIITVIIKAVQVLKPSN